MYRDRLTNTHLSDIHPILSPRELKEKIPLDPDLQDAITESRNAIARILHQNDPRFLVICGPCSIHDPAAALEYGEKLKALSDELSDQLYIVMRAYFEKPRTTVGWKGLINDPNLDGSFDLQTGLQNARKLLLKLAKIGLPLATEALDPISPQFLGELFSWSAIGARTTESQTHREMASGLSMPVGFKNGTNGGLEMAVNAVSAAATSHRFMGIDQGGKVAVVTTEGNPDAHVILRGGKYTNYDSVSVTECEEEMKKQQVRPTIMIDCSHANSRKNYTRQPLVAEDVVHQVREGNRSIIGIMLESNINPGNQSAAPGTSLKYGVSITDACIGWEDTETLLRRIHKELTPFLAQRLRDEP